MDIMEIISTKKVISNVTMSEKVVIHPSIRGS